MNKMPIHLIVLSVILWLGCVSKAYPSDVSGWDLSPDGAMVVTYRTITKDGVLEESFKHRILVQSRKVSQCNEVKIEGARMHLTTQEADPSVYVIEAVPYERLKEVFIVRKPYLNWVR